MPDIKEDDKDDERENSKEERENNDHSGATFLVRIQYRQNSSWQGTIQWLEEKKTKQFRSELELIMLMNEASEKAHLRDDDAKFSSWENKEGVS